MAPALNTESSTVVNVPAAAVAREASGKDVYVRQSSGLVRTVGARTALFANLVAMGIIVNYFWIVFASTGYPNANLVTTVGIGVLINVGVGYVYWMLSSAMPRSGGDYVFMGRIFHPSIGLGTNLIFTVVFISWAGLFAWYISADGIPMMLAAYSVAGGGSQALAWASWFTASNANIFMVGSIVLVLVILVSLLPTKWVFRTTVGIFVVTAVIYVIMLALLLATPQSTFAAHWNAANPASQSYQAIASGAASATTITLSGTFLGVVYTMLSFIGYANSSYFAGEVRGNPTRTQGLAIFGAPIIFAALIGALYAATYYTFGRNFIIGVSAGYLYPGTYGVSVSLPALPSPLFLAAYLVSNPTLAAFLAFGLTLTFFGFSFIYFIIPTRNLFAWSFDRVLPSFFARVSSSGVPYVAVLTLGVGAFISLWVATYTTLFTYLNYSNFGFWLAVGIVCLGGALFPFLRPQLFAQAPRIVRAKIGPVPILTIVGIASWAGAWFVSYAASTIQYLGITGSYPYAYLIFLPIVFVVGIVGYFVSYAIQRRRGVPVDLIAKELPPD
ncbi:MAG TPA: amino acid permease [Thermoplasmata archaeon]|nr:amino acid permease [Thermoplasmata archaeon]